MEKKHSLEIHYTDSESGGSESEEEPLSVSDACIVELSNSKPALLLTEGHEILGTENKDNSDSSSSSSSSESELEYNSNVVIKDRADECVPLLNPFAKTSQTDQNSDSVFSIPIRENGDQESSNLERHVKLTPSHKTQLKINGKRICWKYRKGTCRFGTKCIFAHDSDIPLDNGSSKDVVPDQDKSLSSSPKRRKWSLN